MGTASAQVPFIDRNMPYMQAFQPEAEDVGAVPIFVILSSKYQGGGLHENILSWRHLLRRLAASGGI